MILKELPGKLASSSRFFVRTSEWISKNIHGRILKKGFSEGTAVAIIEGSLGGIPEGITRAFAKELHSSVHENLLLWTAKS